MFKKILILSLVAITAVSLTSCQQSSTSPASKTTATQPAQPASGPGGKDYKHQSVSKNVYHQGTAQEFWIFDLASPLSTPSPVIVFNHGWGAMNPSLYAGWIDHLVKKGNVVIWPRYQASLKGSPEEFTPNAIAAVKKALTILGGKADKNNFAIAGHSMGGIVSANMAALAASSGLPAPKAVMAVEPGLTEQKIEKAKVTLADLSQIPSTTLLLTLSGDQDKLARDTDAKKIFNQSTKVIQKNYIIVQSDDHGAPALIANHGAPTSPIANYVSFSKDATATDNSNSALSLRDRLKNRLKNKIKERLQSRINEKFSESFDLSQTTIGSVNALDFYGYWKLFDGLTDCAFRQTNCNYALGDTLEQKYMGKWSDGVAVKGLQITTNKQ